MRKLKEIMLPALSLFLVCLCAAAALALTNAVTKSAIAKQDQKKLNETMVKIIETDSYKATTLSHNGVDYTYYTALSEQNETMGYIFLTAATGYNGDVSVMVGINPDGTVKVVEILDASGETPSLGQRVSESSFLEQFSNKTAPFDTQVDTISGATYSSRAVVYAVNTACELYAQLTGGEGNE